MIRFRHKTINVERASKKLVKKVDKAVRKDPSLKGIVQWKTGDERFIVEDSKDLRAHWVSPGGYIETTVPHTEVFEPLVDFVGVHVSDIEDKLLVNKEAWNRLAKLTKEALVKRIHECVDSLRAAGQEDATLHFAMWAPCEFKQYVENDNWYYHLIMRYRAGGVVIAPS